VHGQCVVAETILLRAGRRYTGDSRAGTTLTQANGSNLQAVVASEAYMANYSWTDNPLSIAHLTIDGNKQGSRSRTHGLALRAWFYSANDLRISNCGGDGLLVGTATPRLGVPFSFRLVRFRS
jgi:hypothetical protein